MTRLTAREWARHDLPRYFAVSLLALAVDMATLSACLRLFELSLAWSATLGFAAGAAVAYVLSIRWVFRQRAFGDVPAFEFASFVAIGIAGLGVTQLVLWIGVGELGLLPEAVKLAAAGVTFVFNYLARKTLLFAAHKRTIASSEDTA